MSFSVDMPVPPSLNNSYRNGPRGRSKTAAYRTWLQQAGLVIRAKVPEAARIAGPFRVSINLPYDTRGDIDNRVKGIIDSLVASGRIDDDRHMEELHVRRRAEGEWARVYVTPHRPERGTA